MIELAFFEQFDKKPPVTCTCGVKIPLSGIATLQYYRSGCRGSKEKQEYKNALLEPNDMMPKEIKPCCIETMWNHKRLF